MQLPELHSRANRICSIRWVSMTRGLKRLIALPELRNRLDQNRIVRLALYPVCTIVSTNEIGAKLVTYLEERIARGREFREKTMLRLQSVSKPLYRGNNPQAANMPGQVGP
jgi:hypothetical protein